MIYRKWSLLTGPAAVFGGIAGALIAVDYIFRQKDQSDKPAMKKQELMHAAK